MSDTEIDLHAMMARRVEEAERGCKALRLELEALRQEKETLVRTVETLQGAAEAIADELDRLRREPAPQKPSGGGLVILMLTPEQAKALLASTVAINSPTADEARLLLRKAIDKHEGRLCSACGSRKP